MEKFKKVIGDLTAIFEEYLPLEQKKLKAVQEDNIAVVEECMTQEQALILKLRGLDQKRINAQKELGWEGKNFRQIVDSVPQDERQEIQELLDNLDNAMTVFHDTNKNAMTTMEVHLREINKIIRMKDTEGRYSQDGNPMEKDRPMTSRKV